MRIKTRILQAFLGTDPYFRLYAEVSLFYTDAWGSEATMGFDITRHYFRKYEGDVEVTIPESLNWGIHLGRFEARFDYGRFYFDQYYGEPGCE